MHSEKFAGFSALAGALMLAAAIAVLPALAQGPRGPKYANISASVAPTELAPGHAGDLVIRLQIAPGFHVNSAKPNDPSLIATAFAPASAPGLRFGAAHYPKVVMIKEAGSSQAIPVYTGAVKIVVPFTVARAVKPGSLTVGGTLTYQGCNLTSCYPPKNDAVRAMVTVK